jgi:putative glutamine amidotransferase
MRPLIALSSYVTEITWNDGVDRLQAAMLPFAYVTAIERAGGLPILTPSILHEREQSEAARQLVAQVDGLLISGGPDVEPARYGQDAHPLSAWQSQRDGWEMSLVLAALECNLPILGICRGAQVLNVVLGGSLVQHLPDQVGHDSHKAIPGGYGNHAVRLAPDSLLGALLGEESLLAPSSHHQSVGRLGNGVVATAWAPDGTIEAIEVPSRDFVIGVQWHPEMSDDLRLFTQFVDRARQNSLSKV